MEKIKDIELIEGEIFDDHRGRISSLNNFHFEGVKRMYVISHPDTETVRAWHGHRFERKWFWCLKGSFTLAFVRVDDWEHPSADLEPEIFSVDEEKSRLICIPPGYANGLKAGEPDSRIAVFSDKILEDALLDSWRYDRSMWVDWSKY